jgi:hypothetical protein
MTESNEKLNQNGLNHVKMYEEFFTTNKFLNSAEIFNKIEMGSKNREIGKNLKDFLILKELGKVKLICLIKCYESGQGSTGIVFKVRSLMDGKIYAMKKIKINHLVETQKKSKYNTVLGEILVLKTLENNNILQYYTSFIDIDNQNDHVYCILTQYAQFGDLQKVIPKYSLFY